MRLGLYYDLRNPGAARPWAGVYAVAISPLMPATALAGRTGAGLLWIDPDLMAPYLAALACAGLPVTDVFCFADIGGLDDDLVDRHTELATRELAPLLAEEGEL